MVKWKMAIIVLSVTISEVSPLNAKDFPTIDSDGHLGKAATGDGDLHMVVDVSVANGDFSRGAFDDDAASVDQLPMHGSATLAWTLHRDAASNPDLWIEASSANGFHSPVAIERTSPRAWYESNNLLAVLYKPNNTTNAALSYLIKTSPNGISPTSHELAASVGYATKNGIGSLAPSVVLSVHTRGGKGVYSLFSIDPNFKLAERDSSPTLSVPVRFGIGWDDFYGSGTGTAVYGSAGLAFARPFALGSTNGKIHAELLALFRDKTVRSLGKRDAENAAVVPLATIGISLSY